VSTLSLDDLRRLCGYRPPLRRRPRCQHRPVWWDRCDRASEYECDPGDGHRPWFVCGTCVMYQHTVLGPVVLSGVEVPRLTAEGGIVCTRRGTRR
jgi:hypothetical protein